MSTLKTHNLQSPDAGSVNIALAPNNGMVVAGLSTYSNQINVGSNIKLGTAGVVTATSFVGALPISNDTNNRVLTGTGSGGINGEEDLTFDGNQLYIDCNNYAYPLVVNSTQSSVRAVIRQTNDANANSGLAIQKKHSSLHPANHWYGDISFEGWDGSGYHKGGLIECVANGTPANDNMPGELRFSTNAGGTNPTKILTITKDGSLYHTGGGDGRRYSFAGDGTSHYMKFDNTLNGIILNGYGGIAFETYGANERLRITSGGRILGGNHLNDRGAVLQIESSDHAMIGIHRNTADHGAPAMNFSASRGTSAGSNTIVQSGDYLGLIRFSGADGSDLATGAMITGIVDGTPGSNAMPTRLGFWTSADGSQSPVERLRIDHDGYVTKPETPSWMLRPSYSSNQTLGGGSHAIGWSSGAGGNASAKGLRLKNVTLSGSGFGSNIHNGQSVGKITVPVAGVYYIWCTIRMENNPTAGNLFLYIDGTSYNVRQHVEMWAHRPYMHGRIEHIVNLNANSYIIWGLNCSGGVVSGINDTVNWCGGHLIG